MEKMVSFISPFMMLFPKKPVGKEPFLRISSISLSPRLRRADAHLYTRSRPSSVSSDVSLLRSFLFSVLSLSLSVFSTPDGFLPSRHHRKVYRASLPAPFAL